VYVIGRPGHPANVGVIVTVDTIVAAVAFIAVKPGVLTVPLAINPIVVFEFVQLKVAPAGVLTKVFAGTKAPAQNTRFGSAVITGGGFTVTTTASVDVHPLAVFVVVTVYVVVVAATPPFVNVTVGFDTVLLLKPATGDHKYVFPATATAPSEPVAPEQIVISAPALETGAALAATVTTPVTAHNVAVFVTVTV
jgi:hypothetical protein